MFSFTEFQGQSSLDKHGTIRISTTYVPGKKPAWWVLLKLAVLMVMVAIGTAIVMPPLTKWLPPWKAALVTIGILQIYIGVSFFVRPEPNSDNMGWFGGLANDPLQYSDNINRLLLTLHMLLGPGRFASEAMLDACSLIGLAKETETVAQTPLAAPLIDPSSYSQAAGKANLFAAAIPAPRSDRFDSTSATLPRDAEKHSSPNEPFA